MTPQQQRAALGVSADAYQGLIVLEIEGPPVVTLTPIEFRRFHTWEVAAYQAARRDSDCLHPRNRQPKIEAA